MISHGYILGAIAIMAIVTFILRGIPFLLMRKKRIAFIDYLGFMMPPGIMVILVAYSMNSFELNQMTQYINLFGSSLCVILLHHFFRNPLLSILLGTAIYIGIGYLLPH